MKKYITKILAVLLIISTVSINAANTKVGATNAPDAASQGAASVAGQDDAWPKGPSGKSISAAAAIVMELNTGTILYKKNMNEKHYPASITKIMTTLLCLENASLDDTVTFSYKAVHSIEYGSSHIGVVEGEQIRMEDCLYGIMLMSANEVCNGVAEHVAGSIDAFVDMMNAKAKELGCKHTHFANPNGLYLDDHYTTAYDMALIASAAMKNEEFRKITGTKTYTIPKTNLNDARPLYNKHNMLHPITYPYGYDYCIGGKTGYTDIARYTLVTFAKKGDMEIVCVVMKTAGPPRYEPNEYTDTISLMNFALDNFSAHPIETDVKDNDSETTHSLFSRYNTLFDKENSPLYIEKKAGVTLPKGVDVSQAERNVELYDTVNYADGENIIGKITYTYAGRTAGEANIIYDTTKAAANPLNEGVSNIIKQTESIHSDSEETEAPKEEQPQTETDKKEKSSNVIWIVVIILAAVCIIAAIVLLLIRRAKLRKRYSRFYQRRYSSYNARSNNRGSGRRNSSYRRRR